ncbi:MAG: Uma2 family endonuclease [Planctomycetes bacterium]|nr:Uma2 family endonuclease [Planctomycetota bacterium]
MAETGIHVAVLLRLLALLRFHFREQLDHYYFASNMYLYYRKGRSLCRAPDVMAIKGVDGRFERRSFKTWVEKAAPCFIVEVTSKKTAREDRIKKKRLYQRLGVREYFLFDPLHEYLPEQLIGYRLKAGKYRSLPFGPGESLESEELGLRMVPDGYYLRLFDRATGVELLPPEEAVEKLKTVSAALERERARSAALAAELERIKGKGK